MSRIRDASLWKKERGYDLEFRQHERPALRNSRHALCDVVYIHSGVRREPREDQAGCSDNKAGALLNDRNDLDLG